jgi:hypothetical protein
MKPNQCDLTPQQQAMVEVWERHMHRSCERAHLLGSSQYWDQASVLVQAGLLQNSDLPVAGVETAQKILDPDRPSNTLIKRAIEEARGRKFASGRQKQSSD